MRLSYGMSASFWVMTFVNIYFLPVRERKGICSQQLSAESRLKQGSRVRKPIKEKVITVFLYMQDLADLNINQKIGELDMILCLASDVARLVILE